MNDTANIHQLETWNKPELSRPPFSLDTQNMSCLGESTPEDAQEAGPAGPNYIATILFEP